MSVQRCWKKRTELDFPEGRTPDCSGPTNSRQASNTELECYGCLALCGGHTLPSREIGVERESTYRNLNRRIIAADRGNSVESINRQVWRKVRAQLAVGWFQYFSFPFAPGSR